MRTGRVRSFLSIGWLNIVNGAPSPASGLESVGITPFTKSGLV